jgi:two-component system LytT family response regulator
VRILIVDDEPLARRGLRRELERLPGVDVVAEARGRDDAVAAITSLHPDVVLLDIQLGRRTGFEVIEAVGPDAMPPTIFVTAYDKHAVRAFDTAALDYVLKPVDPARLRAAIDRAERQLLLARDATLGERMRRAFGHEPAPTASGQAMTDPGRIAVDVDGSGRHTLIDIAAIDWIEADGNRVRLHLGARTVTLRETLARIEQRCRASGSRFIRVRRSALVNVRAIASIERYSKGMWLLRLRSGGSVVSSRRHAEQVKALLRPAKRV